MTLRGLNGVSHFDNSGGLKLATTLLTNSGVIDTFQKAIDAKLGKGRPGELPRYTALAVFATWFHLMYQGHAPSIANILRRLWMEYSTEQLTILGLAEDWRDETRLAAMRASTDVHRQEYNRLRKFVVDALEPIDDTPFQARKNITWAEVDQAVADNAERLRPKTEARNTAANNIIAASVPVELFAGFRGHLATDGHNVLIAPDPRNNPTQPNRKKLGPPMSTYAFKQKRVRGAAAIGLTLAIATYEPGHLPVPNIALGMGLGPVVAADVEGALIAIDAADRHPVMPKPGSNAVRFVVGDKAYPYARNFVAELNERGRYMLGDYRIGQGHVTDLWVTPEDTDCPKLANGCIVCPGIPRAMLEAADPHLHEKYDDMTIDELHEVNKFYDRIEAARMPTNGRPKRSVKRQPGRPRKHADSDAETVFKVEVYCPARRGKIRCPRVPESMDLLVPHLATPPEGTTSYVCTGGPNSKTQISISERDFKTYSPLMAGTLDHHDFYKHARAHNEGFHTYLVSPDSANLRDRTLRSRRNSSLTISIAFGVAIANIRSTDAFLETRRRNGGTTPEGSRTTIRKKRDEGFAA